MTAQRARLGSLAEIERTSVNPSAITPSTSYVGLEHINSDGSFSDITRVNPGDLASTKFRFTPRHLLFGKLRPYLRKIARPSFSGICSTDIIPILPSLEIDRDYLYHFLRTDAVVELATALSAGVNLPRLSPKLLLDFEIPLPPLDEQRRIAAILDQADDLRRKRSVTLRTFDQLIGAVFSDMFGDPSSNSGRWQVSTLGDISRKITDGEHLNPTFSENGMPIVMAGHVLDDGIDLNSSRRVPIELGTRFRRKCDPQPGDLLLVSRGATIGRITVVAESTEFCLMGSVILIKPDADVVAPLFLTYLLKHPVMHARLYATSGSSAQQAIYLKDVRSLRCILPPLRAQHEFADKIRRINSLKFVLRNQLSLIDDLFASLQHHAFAGTLVSANVEGTIASIQRDKLAVV